MIEVDSELGAKLGVGYRDRPILTMDIREQLTLNQRAAGSIPARPTIFFKHLRASRLDPARGKTCFNLFLGFGPL